MSDSPRGTAQFVCPDCGRRLEGLRGEALQQFIDMAVFVRLSFRCRGCYELFELSATPAHARAGTKMVEVMEAQMA